MIEIRNVTKCYDNLRAVDDLSCDILPGGVFGLVGVNGSGKSTLLRLISGVYHADEGSIKLFGEEVYDNPEAKKHIIYVPDNTQLVMSGSNMLEMAKFYAACYEKFSFEKFEKLTRVFNLNPKARIRSFSKGMMKQAQTVLALSCNTDMIMFDETYDGLDPLAKQIAAKLIYAEVCDRSACVIMTSHSLRELEDTCDTLALMYKGKLILQSDIGSLKTTLFKIQVAFADDTGREAFENIEGAELLSYTLNGRVATVIMKGDKAHAEAHIRKFNPLIFEMLPITLEEVFAYQMDALGYDFSLIMPE